MKNKYKMLLLMIGLVLLVGCKPSDKYIGDWHAVTDTGEKVMINFSKEKTMTISGDDEEESFEINQTTTGLYNGTRYFRIEIEGAGHYVIFDQSKDEDNAKLVKQTNQANDFEDVVGDVIYLLNRNDFPVD